MRGALKILLFCLTPILGLSLHAQGNKLSISGTAPKNLSICGLTDTSRITIYNISSSNISGVSITLTLPAGVNYIAGSISSPGVTESNITNTNKPIFKGPNLLIAQNFVFRVKLKANCDLLAKLGGSYTPVIDVRVDYTGNFDMGTSLPFVPSVPSPGYSSISNQSFTGDVGDIFVRKYTITNYGKGPINTVVFARVNGKDLQVKSQKGFSTKVSGDSIITTFDKTAIKNIGNGDTLFDQNESVSITDTVKITGCKSLLSNFLLLWGCEGKYCQVIKSNGLVTISAKGPLLKAWTSTSLSACLDIGTKNAQGLIVTNTGQLNAKKPEIRIFQTYNPGAGYYPYLYSRIDTASIYIKKGFKGALVRAYADSAISNYPYTCLGAKAMGFFRVRVADMQPKDTIYIYWNMYQCAPDVCNPSWYGLGWSYDGWYLNQCNTRNQLAPAYGIYPSWSGTNVSLWAPTDVASNETRDFKYTFGGFNFMPLDSSARILLDFVLPKTLTHSKSKTDFFIANSLLTSFWYPDSIVRIADTLRGYFGGLPKFNPGNGELTIRLKGDCSKSTKNDALPLTFNMKYTTSTKCKPAVWIKLVCHTTNVKVHCSKVCNGGMQFRNFEVQRSNFGIPDNDNNGLADAPGSKIDSNNIRRERAMVGDTVTAVFYGKPKGKGSITNWRYAYAESIVTYGSYLDVIDAQVIIIKAGKVTSGTCKKVWKRKTVTGLNATFNFDFSIDTIYPGGCLSSTYRYSNNDSVMLKVRYKITGNYGGAALPMTFSNRFYLSDVANPGVSASHQCDTFSGSFINYSYYFANYGPDNIQYGNCAPVALSQSYYLGMGPCCSNYAGADIFPYEYRNWARISKLRLHLPKGLQLQGTYFGQYRTAGIGRYVLEQNNGIQPVAGTSNPYVFDLEKLHKDKGGNLNLSDDGFQGYFTYYVQPQCDITANKPLTIKYDYIFERRNAMGTGFDTITQNADQFTFTKPAMSLVPAIQTVYANSDTAEWEVRYSNPSSSFNAYNIWLSPKKNSNIRVVQVRDAVNDTLIKPQGDIYRAGLLNAGQTRRFRVRAVYSSCAPDSLIIYGAWNCTDYPVDFASYPCTPDRTTLLLEPKNTRIQLTLTDSASVLDLCAGNKMTLLVENIQDVTAYKNKIQINLPIGMSILGGSEKIRYPLNSSTIGLGAPKLISGTSYEWDLSALVVNLGKGFTGTADTSKNKMVITFRVTTNCDYASGSFISARAIANIKCGDQVPAIPAFSNPLDIKGIVRPYYTLVKSWTDTILPCTKPFNLRTRVMMLGPLKSGNKDRVEVFLPKGISWDSTYWIDIRKAPKRDSVLISKINGATLVSWLMPTGIAVGDSIEFETRMDATSKDFSCGKIDLLTRAVVVQSALCITSNTWCDIKVITGGTLENPMVDKGNLLIESPSANVFLKNADTETVSLKFRIRNKSRPINNSTIKVRYYYDGNASGKWEKSDKYLGMDSMSKSLQKDSFLLLKKTLNVPAGQSCAIIALIDSAACACKFAEVLFPAPQFLNAGNDTAICSGSPLLLGRKGSYWFGYKWDKGTWIDNVITSQPSFIAKNQTGIPETYALILTTYRGACLSKDTVTVVVNPIPSLKNNFADTQICLGRPVRLGAKVLGGVAPYTYTWSPATGLSNAAIKDPVALAAQNTRYDLLLKDKNNCSAGDTSRIGVNPYPVAKFGWPITCANLPLWITDSSSLSSGYIALRTWKTPVWDTFGVSQVLVPLNGKSSLPVTLVVTSDIGCSDTFSRIVDVKALPKPAFSVKDICLGESAEFMQNSTVDSGSITGFDWDLGDGNYEYSPAVSHKYSLPGLYMVTLKTTSNNGCYDTVSHWLWVHSKPKAGFAVLNACEGDTLKLTNQSLLNGDSLPIYSWDLGKHGTSAAVHPAQRILAWDNFNVKLVMANSHGCMDSSSKAASIWARPKANFGHTAVCLNLSTDLTDSSTLAKGSITNWNWTLGDGGVSYTQNAQHLYATEGQFNVGLHLKSDKGCADSTTKVLTVHAPVYPSFTANSHCLKQSLVATAMIRGNGVLASYAWDLGDGSNAGAASLSHQYATTGNYLIKLSVLTDKGCKRDTQATIAVWPLPITTSLSAANPCSDDSLVFSHKVGISNGAIMNNAWKFSDGSTFTGYNLSRIFNPSGNYDLKVISTSDRGCVDSASVNFDVYLKAVVDFSLNEVCLDEETQYLNKSISFAPVSRWAWNFGDGKNSASMSPVHTYKIPGTHPVDLVMETQPGCIYTIRKNAIVHPKPFSAFRLDPATGTIVNPFISVWDESVGADSIWYRSSDGYSFTQRNFSHMFPDSGSFSVHQYANTLYGCEDSSTRNAYINFMYTLHVPTAFTPNNNTLNDRFGPDGMGIMHYDMHIFNRWGEHIYGTTNSEPWDGTYKGSPVAAGIYPVLVSVLDYKGKMHYYKGTVYLIR